MVLVGSTYLRQGLIVQHCGYFLIHMVLRYPINMLVIVVVMSELLYLGGLMDKGVVQYY